MKIFDGVTVNPAGLDPKWQGVLGVAMLVVTFVVVGFANWISGVGAGPRLRAA